jgi:hypothetical protein
MNHFSSEQKVCYTRTYTHTQCICNLYKSFLWVTIENMAMIMWIFAVKSDTFHAFGVGGLLLDIDILIIVYNF